MRGGLCNRLQGLLSGSQWADAADRSLRVAWPVDARFGAHLNDLFEHSFNEVSPTLVKVAARVCGGYHTHEEVRLEDRRRVLVAVSGKRFLIDDEPLELEPGLPQLRPVRAIATRVRSIASWDEPVVGVMIRANNLAHAETTSASPVSWFVDRMASIRAERPDTPFFLSTDSPPVSERIHGEFSNVFELGGKSAYNSGTGVQDAVADLYLLASTTYILGSTASSFSDMAALIAGHGGYETSQHEALSPWSERCSVTVRCALGER